MRSLSSIKIAFVFLIPYYLFPRAYSAETFEERHARDVAANPFDLQFRLSIPNGQSRFLIGERIPVNLEFSSRSPEKYKLNGATYDRSGRLPTEEFALDRDDVADPYQDYFGIGVMGGIAGGLRTNPVLNATPHGINLELNAWFRFENAGRYRLYVKSHRLSRERAADEPGDTRSIQFAAVSNIIEIEILARDPNWESMKLTEIRAVLNQPEPKLPKFGEVSHTYDPSIVEKIALAKRELSYLGSPEALGLMFEQAKSAGEEPDMLTLIGSPDRSQAIADFDSYLSDPTVSIKAWEIRLRALFTFVQKEAPKVLPNLVWQLPAGTDWKQVHEAREAMQKQFDQFVKDEAERLIPIVSRKSGLAREVSSEAIAALAPDAAKAAGLIPPDDYGLTREQLIAQFPQFAAKQQSELLANKWDLVRGPEMIPALLDLIAKESRPKPLPDNPMMLSVWGADTGIAQTALERLSELAPGEAIALLRDDIASGKPRFAAFEVLELPVQDVPEADAALSALLKTSFPSVLPLVAKFGTVRLADQMHTLYESYEGPLPCMFEQSFLIYFLRTSPGNERGAGKDLLQRAMANRERRGCYRTLLSQIANVLWNPVIEGQAVATMNDPDLEAASGAAGVLAAHGGPEAEPILWERLEKWSAKWKGHVADLDENPITEVASNPGERRLGDALFSAISSAKSWILDEPRRRRLLNLCLDEPCRKEWSVGSGPGPILVDASSGGPLYPTSFRVAGYGVPTFADLKMKLQQYPAGSKFQWCPQAFSPFDAFSPGQRKEMFEELSALLSKRFASIEPYSEEKCVPGK